MDACARHDFLRSYHVSTSTTTSATAIAATTEQVNSQQAKELYDRLDSILEEHHHWKDDLSLDLRKWGLSLLSLCAPDETMTAEQFREEQKDKLDELEKSILINPLTSKPLVKPLIDRGRIWEERMQQDYLQYSLNSPFDDEPIEVAVPHKYAEEMISWLCDVRGTSANPTHSEIDLPEPLPLKDYLLLANWAQTKMRSLNNFEKELRQQDMQIAGYQQAMQADIAADVARLQAQQQTREKQLNEELKAIETNFQQAMQADIAADVARLHS